MFRIIRKLIILIAVIVIAGCASMLRIDGPYEGKVIDAETKQPIGGAVVHGTWNKMYPGPGGAVGEYYDSYEVLTDKNGEFKIPGKGLLLLSDIDGMIVTIFKAGYEQIPPNSWRGLKKGKWPNDEITWEGDKGTFKLRRMTLEERLKRVIEEPLSEPNQKLRLFHRESNRENIELGRPADTLFPEE